MAESRDGEEKKDDVQPKVPLTWRDYLALYIAALQTVLLPLVIFIVVLFFFVLVVTGHV